MTFLHTGILFLLYNGWEIFMPIPGLFALRPIVCASSALLAIANKAESLFPAVLVSEVWK